MKLFLDCEELTKVDIPDSATSIGYKAFYDCKGLESVNLPSLLIKIGSYAFGNCYNLKYVYYPSENPIESVSSDVFSQGAYSKAELLVPKNAISLCKERAPWENFNTIKTHDDFITDTLYDIFYGD